MICRVGKSHRRAHCFHDCIYIYIVPSDKWKHNGNGADVNKGTKILKIWALYQK